MESRLELQLQSLLGESVNAPVPHSRLEKLLECIRLNEEYPHEPISRIEQYFLRLLDETVEIPDAPQCRAEEILDAMIYDKDLTGFVPMSRYEELLLALKEQKLISSYVYPYLFNTKGLVNIDNAASAPIKDLVLFGKSTQAIPPSFNSPQPIASVGENGLANLTITSENGTRTVAFQTPNGLSGIPHYFLDDANMIDDDDICWRSDEINYKRGKYSQRVQKVILDGINHEPVVDQLLVGDRVVYRYLFSGFTRLAPYFYRQSVLCNMGKSETDESKYGASTCFIENGVLSYTPMEPIGDNDLVVHGNTIISNGSYCIGSYYISSSEGETLDNGYGYLVAGETYTVSVCFKPNVTLDHLDLTPGNASGYGTFCSLATDGTTNKQIATAVFVCSYYSGAEPSDGPNNNMVSLWRLPYESGTEYGDTTIYWIKIERGKKIIPPDEFKAALAENPMVCLLPCYPPIERDLTEEELRQYQNLRTFNGENTITSNVPFYCKYAIPAPE